MKYKELLEQYKQKALSPEAMSQVEADIEKQDAISNYLAEQLEKELDYDSPAPSFPEDALMQPDAGKNSEKEFESFVRKSIRRSFRNMGLAILGVLLAVVLFVQFGLSPLVNRFYYNPGEEIAVSHDGGHSQVVTNRFSRDLSVLTELSLPLSCFQSARVLPLGYGKYDVTLTRSNPFFSVLDNCGGRLDRGKLSVYDANFFNPVNPLFFANFGLSEDPEASYREQLEKKANNWFYAGRDIGRERIDALRDNQLCLAYVSFDRRLDCRETDRLLRSLQRQNLLIPTPLWLGVCTDSDNNSAFPAIGHFYDGPGSRILLTEEEQKLYPWLTQYARLDNVTDYEDISLRQRNEKAMQNRFSDMLRYLLDQKNFLTMMAKASGQISPDGAYEDAALMYNNALQYIEQNGIRYYGFLCYADKSGMQKMLDNKDILCITAMKTE